MVAGGLMTEHWHLDRKVPIALIFTIFVQSATLVWWLSSLNQRVFMTERSITNLESSQVTANEKFEAQRTQVAILVEQIGNTNKNLERLQSEMKDTNVLLRDFLTMKDLKK
jgi:peptidoglycan hydrolase CwlO-like protein